MPRRRSAISAIRTLLYTLARWLGDIQAVRKGPQAMAPGWARKQAWRTAGTWLNTGLR